MKLTRITSGGKFIPEIDGLRFVAIASVVAFHVYQYLLDRAAIHPLGILGTALHHGQRGVPLFFVISGFILGRPFAAHYLCGAHAPKLKQYYLRRLTRLEPPYIAALLAVFLGLAAFSSNRGVAHLLASLVYSHNVIYGAPNPFLGLTWSLEIEVQFYCLIPILALLFTLPRPARRWILFACLFLGVFNLMAMPARVHLSILGWFQCFAAGLLMADLFTDGEQKQHWGFDVVSVLLWPAVFLMNDTLAWIFIPLVGLVLYVAAFRSILFRRFFALPIIATVGGMCYSIYLVHFPMISAVGHVVHGPAFIAVASLVAVGAASLVFFILIERPCMDKFWPAKVAQLIRSRTTVPRPIG
jgi:peptidoglycan/LPS O-acetylase OafA/YrhL